MSRRHEAQGRSRSVPGNSYYVCPYCHTRPHSKSCPLQRAADAEAEAAGLRERITELEQEILKAEGDIRRIRNVAIQQNLYGIIGLTDQALERLKNG